MQLQVYNNTVTFASASFFKQTNSFSHSDRWQVILHGQKNHEQELILSTMQIRCVETVWVPCV
jgi:hypothetical protein